MGSILNLIPFFGATRRNHALEHATMQVLSRRYSGLRMAGISGPLGFTLIGDLPTEVVTDAVLEAQQRLKSGEKELAIHPNCGTNLAASSGIAGAAASMVIWGLAGKRAPRWFQYLMGALVAVPFFLISRPLGPKLQRAFTVEPNLGHQQVRLVESRKTGNSFVHVISTGR